MEIPGSDPSVEAGISLLTKRGLHSVWGGEGDPFQKDPHERICIEGLIKGIPEDVKRGVYRMI